MDYTKKKIAELQKQFCTKIFYRRAFQVLNFRRGKRSLINMLYHLTKTKGQ